MNKLKNAESLVNIMNSYYVNVVAEIGGTDTVGTINGLCGSTPSARYFKNNLRNEGAFMFSQVTESDIDLCIAKKLNDKKVSVYDNIPQDTNIDFLCV